MDRLISQTELKLLLGISDTSQDAEIELKYREAVGKLYKYLNVSSLLTHTVTNERVKVYDTAIYPRDFPAVPGSITVKDLNGDAITSYTFGQFANDLRKVNILDSSGDPTATGYDRWLVSYTAGYTARDTITVLDYTALTGKTLNVYVNGTLAVWEFVIGPTAEYQIATATSNAVTAANIAAALGGTALGAVVTLPEGTSCEAGTVTAAGLTIAPSSLPSAFKSCLAALVSAGLAEKQRSKGIKSYRIGEKSVTYADDGPNSYQDILSEHVGGYRLPFFAS